MRWNMDHTGGRTLLGLVLLTFALCVSSPASARDHVPTSEDCAALTTARLAIRDHAAGAHRHADLRAVLAKLNMDSDACVLCRLREWVVWWRGARDVTTWRVRHVRCSGNKGIPPPIATWGMMRRSSPALHLPSTTARVKSTTAGARSTSRQSPPRASFIFTTVARLPSRTGTDARPAAGKPLSKLSDSPMTSTGSRPATCS